MIKRQCLVTFKGTTSKFRNRPGTTTCTEHRLTNRIILCILTKIDAMNRRNFISSSFSASIAAFLPKLVYGKPKATPSWESLIEWARWAPSVHNLQPQRIKVISEKEALLCYDTNFLLPVGDPKSEFATAVFGIFVESLSIAAASHGYTVYLSELVEAPSTQKEGIQIFGKIRMTERTEREDLNPNLLKQRRTARTDYDGESLADITLERCESIVAKFGATLFSTSDDDKVEQLVKINQQTLFEDLSHADMRKELDGLFRYSKKEAEALRTGLWTKCMGFPGKLVKSVFRHHERWTKGARKKMLSSYYGSTYKGTATILWIQHKWSLPEDQYEFGRMLCRIWLQLTKEGAYMHPFGSLITNPIAFAELSKSLELDPTNDAPLAFVCRVGYSKEPPRSFRINTSDILLP